MLSITNNEATKFIFNLFVKILISSNDFRSLEQIPEEVRARNFDFQRKFQVVWGHLQVILFPEVLGKSWRSALEMKS